MLKGDVCIMTHKGMTLVEIVISFFILSLVAGVFSQIVIGQIRLMQETKAVTKNVFLAAKRAEQTMQEYKDAVNESSGLLPTPDARVLFSGEEEERTVEFYPVIEPIMNTDGSLGPDRLFTLVAKTRPPEFDLPAIIQTETDIEYYGHKLEGIYAATPFVTVVAKETVDKPGILLTTKYQWYISNSGFLMRWDHVDDPNYYGVGSNLPVPLNDYEIIPNVNGYRLDVKPEMAGRHVACLMTPVGLSGKMGRSVIGAQRYLYGLTVLDHLVAHYDASLIDNHPDDIDSLSIGSRVHNWIDISDPYGFGHNASRFYSGVYYPIMTSEFLWGQQVSFNGENWLEVAPAPMAGSDMPAANSSLTIFAVVLFKDLDNSLIMSNGMAWFFDAGGTDGLPFNENIWCILSLSYDNITELVTRTAYKYPYFGSSMGSHNTTDTSAIKIGEGNIYLAELIVYDQAMSSTSFEFDEVMTYLNRKYGIYPE